jgi:hypothetical protein
MRQVPRAVVRWLTSPYFSPLDCLMVVAVSVAVILRPPWWMLAALIVSMTGVKPVSALLRRLANLTAADKTAP